MEDEKYSLLMYILCVSARCVKGECHYSGWWEIKHFSRAHYIPTKSGICIRKVNKEKRISTRPVGVSTSGGIVKDQIGW